MQLSIILMSLLANLPVTHSAPVSALTRYDEPYMCGYVLTVQNSSAYAGLSAYSSCTAIYYNHSIPGYQDAYAYSVFGGCGCSFHVSEEECMESTDTLRYDGPIGNPGKELRFDEPKPKWYNCATIG